MTIAAVAVVVATGAGVVATRMQRGGESVPPEHVQAHLPRRIVERRYAYPLRVSANRRYLVDRRNRPFLIVGDSPQALIGNLSVEDAAAYIADRRRSGYNSLWVDLLCATYTGCRADGTTSDGIRPFTSPGDLSSPNPAYFARADAILRLAARAGMLVFLDPIETGGWLATLRKNGPARDRAYGRFVARRYARYRNIVWSLGNDFQTWRNARDDTAVLAVAAGIRSVDRRALLTVELNYPESASLDDPRWRPLVQIDSAYTQHPTYAKVLAEYDRRPRMPVYLAEAGYEFEQNGAWISKGTPDILRRQEYWAALSGASGQFYGNHFTWQFARGWKSRIDTTGSAQLGYLTTLLWSLPWFRLVPDRTHRLVTAGYGTFAAGGNVGASDYVTTAYTRDGRHAVSYLPEGGTISVDLRRLAAHVDARWYDPSTGTFTRAAGGPFVDRGVVELTAPGRNGDGDRDWALVLRASR